MIMTMVVTLAIARRLGVGRRAAQIQLAGELVASLGQIGVVDVDVDVVVGNGSERGCRL